jgi:hypothetical protein
MRYLSRVFLVWFFIITGFFVIADAAPKDIIKKHNEIRKQKKDGHLTSLQITM